MKDETLIALTSLDGKKIEVVRQAGLVVFHQDRDGKSVRFTLSPDQAARLRKALR